MSTHIHVCDDSLKRCTAAPCSRYRNILSSFVIEDEPGANSQQMCARVDKRGILQLPFVNPPAACPVEPTDECYAIHYQIAKMKSYIDPSGRPGLFVTENSKYIFLSYLSRPDFIKKSKDAKNGYLGNLWEDMRDRHMPLHIEHDNAGNKRVCATCGIKPSNQPDCTPQLFCVAYSQFEAAICMTAIRMIDGDGIDRNKYADVISALRLDQQHLDDDYHTYCGREEPNWLHQYINPTQLHAPPPLMPPEVFMRRFIMAIFRRKAPFDPSELSCFVPALETIQHFAHKLNSDDEYFASFIESWIENLDKLIGIMRMCEAHQLQMRIDF